MYTYISVTDTYIAIGWITATLGLAYCSPPYSAVQAFVFLFPSLCEFSLWFSLDLETFWELLFSSHEQFQLLY